MKDDEEADGEEEEEDDEEEGRMGLLNEGQDRGTCAPTFGFLSKTMEKITGGTNLFFRKQFFRT